MSSNTHTHTHIPPFLFISLASGYMLFSSNSGRACVSQWQHLEYQTSHDWSVLQSACMCVNVCECVCGWLQSRWHEDARTCKVRQCQTRSTLSKTQRLTRETSRRKRCSRRRTGRRGDRESGTDGAVCRSGTAARR